MSCLGSLNARETVDPHYFCVEEISHSSKVVFHALVFLLFRSLEYVRYFVHFNRRLVALLSVSLSLHIRRASVCVPSGKDLPICSAR
jgi:hypothetical protein